MSDLFTLMTVLSGALLAGLLGLRLVVRHRAISDRVTLRLTFPRNLKPDAVLAFVRALAGLLPPWWRRLFVWPFVIFEVEADSDGLTHRMITSERAADYVIGQLRAAIPAIRVEAEEPSARPLSLAGSLRQSAKLRELRVDQPAAVAAAILGALRPLQDGERLLCQWVIAPAVMRPVGEWIDSRSQHRAGSLRTMLPGRGPSKADVKAAQRKLQEPVFCVAARLGATASKRRARLLLGRLTSAFHVVNAADVRLKRSLLPGSGTRVRLEEAQPPAVTFPLLLNARELTALLAFPIESPLVPGLRLGGCRQLPPSPSIKSVGRVLAEANFPGAERPLAISPEDSLMHLHVVGPTGTGKSTLLLNLAAQDMRAGATIVIDPKGDLADDLLDRVPPARAHDVICIDPTDIDRPVGLPLFNASEGERELMARNFVGIMQRIWASSWGPRTNDVLSSAVLTLCRFPGMTPCEVPLILIDDDFRRRLVRTLEEPTLISFWSWYEALSPAERASVIGPVMNKIRALVMWKSVRQSIGQSEATYSFDEIIRDGKILIVRLPKGTLGEDNASLLGSLVVGEVWRAVQRRASLPPTERPPAYMVLDEMQDFLNMSTPVADVLAQARGLGLGLVLAHQNLAQLPPAIRAGVLSNSRSKVCFQATASDSTAMAKEFAPLIEAEDLMGLGAREVVMRINTGSEVSPAVTARTYPPTPALGSADYVRGLSRMRYGRDGSEVERSIRERQSGPATPRAIGGRRRS